MDQKSACFTATGFVFFSKIALQLWPLTVINGILMMYSLLAITVQFWPEIPTIFMGANGLLIP